jgi:hypothetical protein
MKPSGNCWISLPDMKRINAAITRVVPDRVSLRYRLFWIGCLLNFSGWLIPAEAQTSTKAGNSVTLSSNEHLITTQNVAGSAHPYVVQYDSRQRQTKIMAFRNGDPRQRILIDSATVDRWLDAPEKGKVHQDFETSIRTAGKANEFPPLEYQYQVQFSPDSRKALVYRYDYSQPTLLADVTIVDEQLQVLRRFQLPIDPYMTNRGLFINNRGDIFILNTDAEDGIHLLRYQPEREEADLLSVSASSARRTGLLLKFFTDTILYLANTAHDSKGNFGGITYSRFNFSTDQVEAVHFYSPSYDVSQQLKTLTSPGFYEPVQLSIQENGLVEIQLEKRTLTGNSFTYDPYAISRPENWQPRKIRVQSGGRVRFQFDGEGNMRHFSLVKPG